MNYHLVYIFFILWTIIGIKLSLSILLFYLYKQSGNNLFINYLVLSLSSVFFSTQVIAIGLLSICLYELINNYNYIYNYLKNNNTLQNIVIPYLNNHLGFVLLNWFYVTFYFNYFIDTLGNFIIHTLDICPIINNHFNVLKCQLDNVLENKKEKEEDNKVDNKVDSKLEENLDLKKISHEINEINKLEKLIAQLDSMEQLDI